MHEAKARASRSLVGSIILAGMNFGTYIVLSNYILDLAAQLHASVREIVIMFSISSLGSMVANLALPLMFRHLRIRAILLIGGACYGIFFAAAFLAESPLFLYVGAVFLGLGVAWCGFAVIQPIITWWFLRHFPGLPHSRLASSDTYPAGKHTAGGTTYQASLRL